MSKDIRIKRGLSLRLKGEAEKQLVEAPRSKTYAIKPPDFHSVIPKMVVKEGAKLLAGDELFYSKYTDEVRFTAPVSGTLLEVKRAEKRRIVEIIIEADATDSYKDFGKLNAATADAESVKEKILKSGCGAFIKQRPYDIVADPKDTPKAIFISAVTTAPLAGDLGFIIKDKVAAFQEGIYALQKLTPGKVHLSVDKSSDQYLKDIKGVELHNVEGPHPAGNVGVQIHHIDPVNMGERVWTIGAEDVATIGNLFLTGYYVPERTVAVTGSEAQNRKYYKTIIGANSADIIGEVTANIRIISGDVLTGTKISNNQYLGFYPNTLSMIPEGNQYRMFGWLPFTYNNIHSNSRTSLSFLFSNKKFEPTTNLNGEERALVVTGEMEEVFPMEIFPMQLIKACMSGDIEKMENLGIYEVAPEDFALVDYTNTSKIEAQEIIRLGLDLMITEVG
ncbi:Na(+)-translocating NADH-quinone reductase subunit A [Antarcticibacterium flavum]|uniref:Na(+)-translocating NADH-quinone reductase subunit A n=1 Tax=Antarcticibacterium flavum TaxID=2058175 RepID=A0A5B7X4D8_9FLAO|nr:MULTISPECIES: Na(+)-translocating NADH-quinone reductase subunit A [Antarcticibacterium]MCM4160060.1 NADH:ubiquinone reductase (Na(+)-transporting) subunit A [Antarcticibacterium sp. W02-3]QCY70354.1 Na(+)-translocating NADH-quinone reductase subunit A [Antarcticibacterium flavum]